MTDRIACILIHFAPPPQGEKVDKLPDDWFPTTPDLSTFDLIRYRGLFEVSTDELFGTILSDRVIKIAALRDDDSPHQLFVPLHHSISSKLLRLAEGKLHAMFSLGVGSLDFDEPFKAEDYTFCITSQTDKFVAAAAGKPYTPFKISAGQFIKDLLSHMLIPDALANAGDGLATRLATLKVQQTKVTTSTNTKSSMKFRIYIIKTRDLAPERLASVEKTLLHRKALSGKLTAEASELESAVAAGRVAANPGEVARLRGQAKKYEPAFQQFVAIAAAKEMSRYNSHPVLATMCRTIQLVVPVMETGPIADLYRPSTSVTAAFRSMKAPADGGGKEASGSRAASPRRGNSGASPPAARVVKAAPQ